MDLNKEIDNIITLQYNTNKNANIGDVCVCPICGRLFIKSAKRQAFCVMNNHACKDSYHNFKRYGTKLPKDSLPYITLNEHNIKRNKNMNDEFLI